MICEMRLLQSVWSVDGDEIFIAGCNASKVVVLRYVGSEA